MFSPPDRHKGSAAAVALCLALTLIAGWSALSAIAGQQQRMARPSGLRETDAATLRVAGERAGCCRSDDDLVAVRAIPGVAHAAVVNQTPYARAQWRVGVAADARGLARAPPVAMYAGSGGLLDAMGLHLVEGRDFSASDYRVARPDDAPGQPIPAAILSRALARRLFGDASALGHRVHLGADSAPIVVGVVEHLVAPYAFARGGAGDDEALLLPIYPARSRGSVWLIRGEPGTGDRAADAVAATLRARGHAIVEARETLDAARSRVFAPHRRAIAWIAAGGAAWLLASGALLSTLIALWLARLQPLLDLHRALGATRGQLRLRLHGDLSCVSALGIAAGLPAAWAVHEHLLASGLAAPPAWPALLAVAAAIALAPQCIALAPIARALAGPPSRANRGAIMRPTSP